MFDSEPLAGLLLDYPHTAFQSFKLLAYAVTGLVFADVNLDYVVPEFRPARLRSQFMPLRLCGQLRYFFSCILEAVALTNKAYCFLEDHTIFDNVEIVIKPFLKWSVARLRACLHSVAQPIHDTRVSVHGVVVVLFTVAWNPPIFASERLFART